MCRPALKKTISAGRWFYTTCTARLAKTNQYGTTGGAMELSIGLVAVLVNYHLGSHGESQPSLLKIGSKILRFFG
jgi:hypothetical protein